MPKLDRKKCNQYCAGVLRCPMRRGLAELSVNLALCGHYRNRAHQISIILLQSVVKRGTGLLCRQPTSFPSEKSFSVICTQKQLKMSVHPSVFDEISLHEKFFHIQNLDQLY